jgi:uncharacterized protein related to proFAR isomerase
VTVDLEAMPQTGLDDAIRTLDLADETMDVGMHVLVDLEEMPSHHCTEQDATETGGGIRRQHEMAERDTPRGSDRTRMPDLEFGEDHRRMTLVVI